jgi:hypothetical protein
MSASPPLRLGRRPALDGLRAAAILQEQFYLLWPGTSQPPESPDSTTLTESDGPTA